MITLIGSSTYCCNVIVGFCYDSINCMSCPYPLCQLEMILRCIACARFQIKQNTMQSYRKLLRKNDKRNYCVNSCSRPPN